MNILSSNRLNRNSGYIAKAHKVKNPCDPKCPFRSGVCHNSCHEYAEFFNANREQEKKREFSRILNSYMGDKKGIHSHMEYVPKKF